MLVLPLATEERASFLEQLAVQKALPKFARCLCLVSLARLGVSTDSLVFTGDGLIVAEYYFTCSSLDSIRLESMQCWLPSQKTSKLQYS